MNQSDKTIKKGDDDMGDVIEKVDVAETSMAQRYAKWLIGAVIVFIVLIVIFSGGHAHHDGALTQTTASHLNDANAELQMNLSKLKEEQEKLTQKVTASRNQFKRWQLMGNTSSQQKFSQQQLTRMSAPSSVYETNSNAGFNPNGAKQASVLAGNGVFSRFANQAAAPSTVTATKIRHPRTTIASGEFIHGVLETAINSSIPGMVRAVITRPVYAYVGERPLIPAGSRLIGQYSDAVLQSQTRVMVIWNRIILPNGISVQVNSPGTDDIGIAGQGADSIDHHFFARFGQAALLSLIGAGVANMGVNTQDQYNSASDYRMAIASSFQQSAQQSLQNQQQTGPTLHIYQGASINVFVAHDLDFYGVLGGAHV